MCDALKLSVLYGLMACFVVWASGCSERPEPVEWEPIDAEAWIALYDSPTGPVNGETVDEVIGTLLSAADDIGISAHILSLIDGIVGGSEGEEGDAEEDIDGELQQVEGPLSGASTYVVLGCPGVDLESWDLDFSSGEVRFDSPGFVSRLVSDVGDQGLAAVIFDGDVLLSFSRCQIGPVTIEGKTPGFYAPDRSLLLADVNLSVTTADSLYDISQSVVIDSSAFSVLLADSSGRSYVVTLDLTQIEDFPKVFGLRGSNGSFSCWADQTGQFGCDPVGG